MDFVSAAEVLWDLVANDLRVPQDHSIEIVEHRVARLNWRQVNSTPRSQKEALRESFRRDSFAGRLINVAVAGNYLTAIYDQPTDSAFVQSVTSRIWNAELRPIGHLALMNLHPEGFDTLDELVDALRIVTDGVPGYLLKSGRYFHYYGQSMLGEAEWLRFISRFLMPCNLVSPRYIGHSLQRGFCSLRLTAAPMKPQIPELVRKMA